MQEEKNYKNFRNYSLIYFTLNNLEFMGYILPIFPINSSVSQLRNYNDNLLRSEKQGVSY